MSNPWQNLMPGGVAFTPRPDEDDDWGDGAPGDPVGEPGPPAPVAPAPVPPQSVSTFVDTPAPVAPEFDMPVVEVPATGTLPVEETPGWAAWGEWDDEPETPTPADPLSTLLAPGQWATHTHADENTAPVTSQVPAGESPVETPVMEVPAPAGETPVMEVPAPAGETPVMEVPAPAGETPVMEVPAPAGETPVAITSQVPATGDPLPQPHPSVPPLHDPALPSAPAPTTPPVPTRVSTPAQVRPPTPTPALVPVEPYPVEGFVPEGYEVNPHTGELTSHAQATEMPAPHTPTMEAPVVEAPVVEAPSPPAGEAPATPEGYWINPFTFAVEPKPATLPAQQVPQTEAPSPPAGEAPVGEAPESPVFVTPMAEAHVPVPDVPVPDVPVGVEGGIVEDAGTTETGAGAGSTSLLATVASVEELLAAEEDFSDVEEAEAAAEAAAKAEKQRQTRATRPVAVTERDVAVLQFLARYRMATYPQLAAAFGISYTALRHRMPRLAREGLVVRKAIGKSAYSVWMPTDAGMKVANMDLTLPTLSWATVAHTLGLVDIGIRFESLGEVVVTEREIRAADTRDQPTDRMHQAAEMTGFTGEQARLYVVEMGDGTKQYAHIPDMVLARPPAENGGARSVAVELELTHKPAAQWRKILTAYLNAPHISQVIYFTHQSKVRSGILQAAKEVGAEHMVRVRKFEPSEESAIPLPGR